MKKLLLSVFAVCSLLTAKSQVIYSQSFDGIGGPTAGGAGTYTFPSGYLLMNVDNGTPAASVSYVNEAWERREDFATNVTDSAAFSTSWYTPAGTANDWMWTPLIGPLPAGAQLDWNAITYDPSYKDGYEVRIMTAAAGPPSGGTGVIGNQIASSSTIFSIAAENTTWTARNVSLSAYTGQSVYIGFRNNSSDKFLLLIDDIQVSVPLNYDAQLVAVDTISEYSGTPLNQSTGFALGGDIKNNGALTLTNVQLNVNIYNSSNVLVHNASSASMNLSAGLTSAFTLTPYMPTVADLYTVQYYVSATEVDQVNSNDTLYGSTIVTDSVYMRDDATVTGGLGIGAGQVAYIGQDFMVNTTDDITSVSMYFTRGYTGKQFAAVIWDMSGGLPNAIIGGTDTLLYPDDSARFYTIPIHGGSLNLTPGRYTITAIEFDSTLSLATTANIYTPGRMWVNWPSSPFGGWANTEAFGAAFAKPYVLRANFGIVCTLANSSTNATDASCNGSADGMITVNNSGAQGAVTYVWTPNVSSSNTASVGAGTYSVTVTDSLGCTYQTSATVNEPAAITNAQSLTICAGDTLMVGTNAYTASGTYTDVLVAMNGCDSTVTTNLTVNNVIDNTTSVAGATISANEIGATYQWLYCDSAMAVIPGETNQNFTATVSGNYAVAVTVNSCTVTSACVNISLTGLNQITSGTDLISVSPNPNNGSFTLKAGYEGTYTIYNELGQKVKTIELNAKNNFSTSVIELNQGVYTVTGISNNKSITQKIVVKK